MENLQVDVTVTNDAVENAHSDIGLAWLEHADLDNVQIGVDLAEGSDMFTEADFGINMDMSEDELQHWGIKGMKWGVRRYQNKDGSLTAAGRKRYNEEVESLKAEKAKLEQRQKNLNAQKRMQARTDKLRADIDELKGRKPRSEEDEGVGTKIKDGIRKIRSQKEDNKPKKPEEMTLEELNEEINRMKAVQQYNSYYSQLNPPKVNKGKEVADKFINQALIPAAVSTAKDVGEKFMKKVASDALGLNEKETKSALQKAQDFAAEAKAIYEANKYNADTKALQDKEVQDANRNATLRDAEAKAAKSRADTADANNRYSKATDENYQNLQREADTVDVSAKIAKSQADNIDSTNKQIRSQAENKFLNNPTTANKLDRMFRAQVDADYESNKARREEGKYKADKAKKDRSSLDEVDYESENKKIKAEREHAQLTNPEWQQKAMESDLAGMDTKIGAGKKMSGSDGTDYSQIAKEILNNTKSIPNPTKTDIERVEEMLENDAFWFNFDAI